MQHIHILGICGTFMGSLARLAKAMGYVVTGSDQSVYPPMSTQLEAAGIDLVEGYDLSQLLPQPDVVIVGNVISRGNPVMEAVLNRGIPYISGPQWLAENVLRGRWVLAVAGTHGKTTAASMLAWILEFAGFEPGYLIGGVPLNFDTSAKLGESAFFVIEADEYDSAFFDKRSKFIHYRPRTLVMNNLEFDHADIFADLAAIQTQFHHLIRTIPSEGLVIYPTGDDALQEAVNRGCWTPTQTLGDSWRALTTHADGSRFAVEFEGQSAGEVNWTLNGNHNVQNALAAMAAARHVGVQPRHSCEALCQFLGVKRRMELLADINRIRVYDDFAHHPSAIQTTLSGLRAKAPDERVTAIIEPRSNTMRQGVHKDMLKPACTDADRVYWLEPPEQKWSMGQARAGESERTEHHVCRSTAEIIAQVVATSVPGEQIVIMSNGGFDGIHQKLVLALRDHYE